ncbi:MAG: CinA family nicotinamide mononucleotide deamidase-related protein [Planctomycetota bacterium]
MAILAVGDELLAGDALDTNSQWLARQVRARGQRVTSFAVVGDDAADVARAVRQAQGQAEVLLITGGLGPTVDDLTRDGVAAALDLPLAERAELLNELEAWSVRVGRRLNAGSRRQAELPLGAQALANPLGTAPGFCVSVPGGGPAGADFWLACFPGVPSEMRPMAEALLERVLASAPAFVSRRLLVCGLTEAALGERLADLMHHASGQRDDARLGITAHGGVLSVVLRGQSSEALAAMEATVRERAGEALFGSGEETLAGVVVAALAARGATLTTAESCTGGLLAGAITAVPGSSAVFREGVVTYANAAKQERLGVPAALLAQHGAVSEPVACAMARGQRSRAHADFALAITGIAGPGGAVPGKPVGTVVIALDDAALESQGEPPQVVTHAWRGSRDELRGRAVTVALDLLRRRLRAP